VSVMIKFARHSRKKILCLTTRSKRFFFSQKIEFNKGYSKLYLFPFMLYYTTGPRRCPEKFNELTSPIWTFNVIQSFLSCESFGVPPGSRN